MLELEESFLATDNVKGQRAFAVFTLGYPAEACEQQDRFDELRIHGL